VTYPHCRDCLAFATEPVMASLSDCLSPDSNSHLKLDETEIRYGLLQVCRLRELWQSVGHARHLMLYFRPFQVLAVAIVYIKGPKCHNDRCL